MNRMLQWLRNRKINELVEKARVFIHENYREPPETSSEISSGNRYSLRTGRDRLQEYSHDAGPQISHSNSEAPDSKPEEEQAQYSPKKPQGQQSDAHDRYSRRDNYNSLSIDRAVRSLSSTDSPARVLQVIEGNTDMSFVDKMLEYINIKHLRDSAVYKAAQVDRRLFSKIVSDRTYKPAKDTCIALSLVLQLSLSEANDILSRAGYVLSHSSKRDVIIEYFFRERIYNLNEVNEILFRLEQKLIGR